MKLRMNVCLVVWKMNFITKVGGAYFGAYVCIFFQLSSFQTFALFSSPVALYVYVLPVVIMTSAIKTLCCGCDRLSKMERNILWDKIDEVEDQTNIAECRPWTNSKNLSITLWFVMSIWFGIHNVSYNNISCLVPSQSKLVRDNIMTLPTNTLNSCNILLFQE